MIEFDPRDPGDVDSYGFDWSPLLNAGETITASTWIIDGPDSGMALGAFTYAPSFSATQTTAWFVGGNPSLIYTVTNSITTSSSPPRNLSRSAHVPIAAVATL